MIGRLQGTLIEKTPPQLLIDVGGVGYQVEASLQTCFNLPEPGDPVILHTHFIVREDAQLLFGFAELRERSLFRILIKANGVGPKLALAILSSIDVDTFVAAVIQHDTASLIKIPDVGKKTAERLVVEINDRLADLKPATSDQATTNLTSSNQITTRRISTQEATSALISLGYKPQQASRLIANVENSENQTSETLIREALKQAGST